MLMEGTCCIYVKALHPKFAIFCGLRADETWDRLTAELAVYRPELYSTDVNNSDTCGKTLITHVCLILS